MATVSSCMMQSKRKKQSLECAHVIIGSKAAKTRQHSVKAGRTALDALCAELAAFPQELSSKQRSNYVILPFYV